MVRSNPGEIEIFTGLFEPAQLIFENQIQTAMRTNSTQIEEYSRIRTLFHGATARQGAKDAQIQFVPIFRNRIHDSAIECSFSTFLVLSRCDGRFRISIWRVVETSFETQARNANVVWNRVRV